MTLFAEFREKLKKLYGDHSTYLLPVIKFILALLVFISINRTLGQLQVLNSIFIVLIVSLLCAVLPFQMTAIFAGIFVLAHCYAIGLETVGVAVVVLIVLEILVLRFAPEKNMALVLAPLAFGLGVPCVIPILFGLLGGVASAISVAAGVFVYYFIHFVGTNSGGLAFTSFADAPVKLELLLNGIFKSPELYLSLAVCVIVTLLVFGIKSIAASYAWNIAIILGSVVYFILYAVGGGILQTSVSIASAAVSAAAACLIGLFVKLFAFDVDYKSMEQFQFEDDDYYYYVKAIPKVCGRKTIKGQLYQSKNIKDEVNDETSHHAKSSEDIDYEKKLEESLRNL